MTATVTKLAPRRFLVEGVVAVVAGRVANEAYARVHTTLAAADRDAESLDRQNAAALADLAAGEALANLKRTIARAKAHEASTPEQLAFAL